MAFPAWLSAVAGGLAKREREESARKNEIGKLQSDYSASLGTPQYGVEAARWKQSQEKKDQPAWLDMYSKWGEGGKGSK